MNGHAGEVNLPVLGRLVSLEMVQELVYLEDPLQVGLGTHLAGGVDL